LRRVGTRGLRAARRGRRRGPRPHRGDDLPAPRDAAATGGAVPRLVSRRVQDHAGAGRIHRGGRMAVEQQGDAPGAVASAGDSGDAVTEAPAGIDIAGVTAWCESTIDGVNPPLEFIRIKGGHSNLTY